VNKSARDGPLQIQVRPACADGYMHGVFFLSPVKSAGKERSYLPPLLYGPLLAGRLAHDGIECQHGTDHLIQLSET
jgi:hypothetical protein